MEPGVVIITLDHFWYFVAFLAIALVLVLWYNRTLLEDIYSDCWEVLDKNRKLTIEVGVLKAMLKAKEHQIEE